MNQTVLKMVLSLIVMLALSACGKSPEEGTWQITCTNKVTATLEYGGGKVTTTIKTYDDDACAKASATTVASGTYKEGEAVTSPAGAKKIDTTFVGYSISFDSDAAVTSANKQKICGLSDWTKGSSKDVSSKSCTGFDNDIVGKTYYSIYKIDGDHLYVGKETEKNDGLTEATRNTELDTELFFKKQ